MEATSPHTVVTTMMTAEEARKRVDTINSQMNNIRALLLDFHEREGWKALGYESWTECVEKEFEQGRRQIFRQFQAAQIEQNINDIAKTKCHSDTNPEEEAPPFPEPEPIPERTLRPLAAVPPEEQATVYQLAKETSPGKLTAKHVEKVVRDLKETRPSVYRIMNTKNKDWWEGEADCSADACDLAGWRFTECEIKYKNESGAWCKRREFVAREAIQGNWGPLFASRRGRAGARNPARKGKGYVDG